MKCLKGISLFLGLFLLVGCSSPLTIDETRGDKAYEHVVYITEEIGTRGSHSLNEQKTATYIQHQCEDMGYDTVLQNFKSEYVIGESQNIIVTKKGILEKEIIVGAHYDSIVANHVPTLKGANDNAGGVGVMLEALDYFKDTTPEYTLKFIFFGAEEIGLEGSKYYVSQLSQEALSQIEVMINIDSILGGDYMYIYGNADERGKYRDRVLKVGKEAGLKIITQEGENHIYPRGTTVNMSDHAAFDEAGVPILFFGSGNWELGDWTPYAETSIDGKPSLILHTEYDNVTFLNDYFPGRIDERLYTFTNLLINIIEHTEYVFNFES